MQWFLFFKTEWDASHSLTFDMFQGLICGNMLKVDRFGGVSVKSCQR